MEAEDKLITEKCFIYLCVGLGFILRWMMPLSLPSQFSPGKALVELEKCSLSSLQSERLNSGAPEDSLLLPDDGASFFFFLWQGMF